MIKEGKYIENEFNLEKPFTKWASVFDFNIVIDEYSKNEIENTFLANLKKSFEQFINSFKFIKLGGLQVSCPLFIEPHSPRLKESGIDVVNILFDNYMNSKLSLIFSNADGWDIFAMFVTMNYQDSKGKLLESDNKSSLLIGVDNSSEKSQLFISFTWEFGAEWFYNEFKEENRKIIRDAILSFYESSPNYKRLRINYLLSGFDLKLNEYTEKEVIVNENLWF